MPEETTTTDATTTAAATATSTTTGSPTPTPNISNDDDDDDDDDDNVESRYRVFLGKLLRKLNRLFVILTYPCMVLFTVLSLLMVVTFCIFPTLVCMTFGVCIYYCLMEDPIPLSVLLRYVLSPDAEDTGYPNLYPLSQQRPVIQSKLIIRKLLKIDELEPSSSTEKQGDDNDYPRKHPFPIQVSTESKCLHFSEPIVMDEAASNTEENTNNGGKVEQEEASAEIPPDQPSDSNSLPTEQQQQQLEGSETIFPSGDEVPFVGDAHENDDDAMVDITIGRTDESAGDKDMSKEGECEITFGDASSDETDSEIKAKDAADQQEEEDYFGICDLRDRGTACDICLLEYRVGDDVAWSPNLECTHAYHKDCVLDWLVRKPTCPNCRSDFLKGKQDEAV